MTSENRFAVAVKIAGYYATPSGLRGSLNSEWTKAQAPPGTVLRYYQDAEPVVSRYLRNDLDRAEFARLIAKLRAQVPRFSAKRTSAGIEKLTSGFRR